MDKTDVDVSSLPQTVQPTVRNLAGLLLDSAGDDLLALAVLGAVLTEDFDAKRMSVRSVVVLKKMDLDLLDRLRTHGPRMGRQRLQAPLFVTEQYIDQSRDSFPVELLEIQRLHCTVLGRDFFESLEFSRPDVRLQCERELKANLIALRQGLLSAHKDGLIGPLLAAAAEHLLRILRALLWLKEVECPSEAEKVITAAEGLLDWKLPGLRNCIAPPGKAGFKQLHQLYRDIEGLSKYVNEINV